jgi:hypothetical protein
LRSNPGPLPTSFLHRPSVCMTDRGPSGLPGP